MRTSLKGIKGTPSLLTRGDSIIIKDTILSCGSGLVSQFSKTCRSISIYHRGRTRARRGRKCHSSTGKYRTICSIGPGIFYTLLTGMFGTVQSRRHLLWSRQEWRDQY